jgi:hypothetical protein
MRVHRSSDTSGFAMESPNTRVRRGGPSFETASKDGKDARVFGQVFDAIKRR